MKKNIKTIIALSAIALGIFGGVSSKLLLSNSAVETQAGTHYQNPTFYFVPSSKWQVSGARFKLNVFDNFWDGKAPDSYAWGTLMEKTYNNQPVYKFTITSGTYTSHIQFLRMHPTDDNWQWDYSNVFTLNQGGYSFGVNTVVMDSGHTWDDTWVVGTTDQYGNKVRWLNTDNFVHLSTECCTPSSNTTRLFVYNSDTHWSSSGKTGIHAWGGSANVSLWDNKTAASFYNLSWFQDDNKTWYGYADIPTNVEKFQLVEMTAENDVGAYQVASDYFSQELSFADTSYRNCIIYTTNQGNNVSAGGAHNDACGANLLTKVLESIDTCSSSELNGYNTYSNINNYYASHATSVLSTEVTTMGGTKASASVHLAGMQNRSAHGLSGSRLLAIMNINDYSGSMFAIIASVMVMAVAIGGYFLLRKKRI